MTNLIPNLFKSPFEMVGVCAFITSEDERYQDISEAMPSCDLDFEATTDDKEHRVGVDLELDDDDDVHFHISIARLSIFPPDTVSEPHGAIRDLERCLATFAGQDLKVTISGEFRLPVKSLPKDGIIATMSAVTTKYGDMELSITGSELSVKGGPIKKLRWSKRGEELTGRITAVSNLIAGPAYLHAAVELLTQHANLLLLQQEK